MLLFVKLLLAFASFALAKPGKRGLGWPWDNKNNPVIFGNGSGNVSWAYNWEAWKPAQLPSHMEYVAMARVASSGPGFAAGVKQTGAKTAFCLNEPDIASQANMNVADAVKFWKTYCEPLAKQGIKMYAPAVSNGGAPSGLAYLDEFLKQCNGCTVAGINLHWYGPSLQSLKSHITSAVKQFPGRKIWLTEFALQQGNTRAFVLDATKYLDDVSQVSKYAVFGAFSDPNSKNSMIASNGKLNTLGRAYVRGL